MIHFRWSRCSAKDRGVGRGEDAFSILPRYGKAQVIVRLSPQARPAFTPRRGLTLVESLVAIGLIAILIGLLLGVISVTRGWSNSASCLNNLRTINTAFNMYALQNGIYPDPNNAVPPMTWERVLTDGDFGLTPQVFLCPSDQINGPLVGSSYDWRDVTDPTSTMAGKSVSSATRGSYVFVLETLPEIHAKRKMNAILSNGEAKSMDQEECLSDYLLPVR